MSFLGDWDEIFEKDMKKLEKYHDIDRIEELINILRYLRNDNFFEEFGNLEGSDNDKLYDSRNVWKLNTAESPFLDLAKKELHSRSPIFLPPLTNFITCMNIEGMYTNLIRSYIYSSGHKITDNEIKSILLGDIGQHVTLFVEDFDRFAELPEFSANFFNRLKKVNWKNKKTKNLDKIIYSIIGTITIEFSNTIIFTRDFGDFATYLEACNALKNNRDFITCEDIVVAYLTCFKILMIDIRPLIHLIID